MKRLMPLLLMLAGCASQSPDTDEGSAVDDFIAINDPPAVQVARTTNQFDYDYINDRYVIIKTRRDYYLAEMYGRCREFTTLNTDVAPDLRYDAKAIRARVDTIRGCRIKTLYEIDETQALELKEIGEAPGENR